ncbi:metallophosphoesterase [Allofournierella massiliensis]|uniref:metallophosphoesterase n=1 Tax=Allofournierella massiliensis TaxID=1650663 RepID=UPI0024B1F0CD|nr:metallophosphoesterase [Fournierella massiliensis]
MAIYTIGDLHLSLGCEKPMDIFPGWQGYMEKLERHWNTLVRPEDTVVLAGDTSWAMKLEDTVADFSFLQRLPGQKLLLKGNHDYWWTTVKKMERFLQENGFDSLHILHNNSILAEGLAVCGTRSWMFDVGEAHDEKVMNRELGRLRASLDAAQEGAERVAFLHYPPVYQNANAQQVIDLLKEYNVKRCFYGHLHGNAIRFAVQGMVDGIEYRLISADALAFCPYKI